MLPWHDIDTVFLDMDGTLLDLNFDNHFWLTHLPKRYGELHGISFQAALDKLLPRMLELRGQLNWYCVDFWSQELKLPIIDMKQEVAHLIRPRPNAVAFLQKLRTEGKTVVLFTNAHEKIVSLKMQHAPINAFFHYQFSSHQLGFPKEDTRAWETLFRQHTFDPARSLFIDDNFDVLRSANEFGIAHLLGIRLPDLTAKPVSSDQFRLLDCFSEIYPA